jgi:ABC-2 type transport system ATP-binding protein
VTAAIEAQALGKDYGILHAVESVDLSIAEGEFFGFLGPNGAGKTTTISMLTTLLRPTRGTAIVAGHDVQREPLAVRREIGLVFQDTTLDGELTAEENLRFAARLYGLPKEQARARIDEALALFGLEERRGDPARTFSGGMRRALDLARGVLHRPRILFLDEPTIGLDPVNRRAIWEHLGRVRKAGTTLFLTTHYLDEADDCDRVAIVSAGRIIAEGTPEALKARLGTETIEVEVERVDGELLDAVRTRTGAQPVRTPTGMRLAVADPDRAIAELRSLLGEEIRSLSVRRATLEDVFVTIAGSDAR